VKSNELRLLLSKGSSRTLFITVTIASAIWALIVVLNALLLASIIVGLINGSSAIEERILQLGALWLFRSLFQSRFEYWCSLQACKIKQELRSEITSGILSYENQSPAHMAGLLVKGLNSLDIYLGRFLPQMVFAVATPLTVLAVMAKLDWLSAVIAVLTLPLIPIFGALIGRYTSDSVSKKWQSLGTLSKYFEDSLSGFITLRIFGRDKTQSKRIGEMGDRYTSETMKVLKISFLSAFVLELCATISVALIAVSVGLRLVDDTIPFFNALAVLILAPEVYFPLRNAASLFHASADGGEALIQLRKIQEGAKFIPIPQHYDFSKTNKISWSKWNLAIPSVIDSTIDSGSLQTGEVVVIVGDSGVGKTSFALNLLGQNFDAQVQADEVELHDGFATAWQQVIGWIPQNPIMAKGSIEEQFKLIEPSISSETIISALLDVGLEISDLPFGLDTDIGGVGEKSSLVSGGQLKKIAVARALIRKPRFIIADEPTSDLDAESALSIMRALRQAVSDGAGLALITHDTELITERDRTFEVTRMIA